MATKHTELLIEQLSAIADEAPVIEQILDLRLALVHLHTDEQVNPADLYGFESFGPEASRALRWLRRRIPVQLSDRQREEADRFRPEWPGQEYLPSSINSDPYTTGALDIIRDVNAVLDGGRPPRMELDGWRPWAEVARRLMILSREAGELRLQLAGYQVGTDRESLVWRPIDTAPKNGKKVILSYVNRHGLNRTVFGRWLTRERAEEADTDGVGLNEGWYECIDNWPDYTMVAITEGNPTHWMPIPSSPIRPE